MRIKTILGEPLLHFLVLGAALFLYFSWTGGGSGPGSTRIVLTTAQIGRLAAGFARTWQRPPTETELKSLIDEHVREEIAVREAMAAGLDLEDTVIRRRLRQKLEFLMEDVTASVPPTEHELQAWLAENANDFRSEPRVAFRQVCFSRDRPGEAREADARRMLARLQVEGAEARIDGLTDSVLLPTEFELSPLYDVARTFGAEFAQRIQTVAAGTWTGPVESGYGLHLVLVRERVEGTIPDLAEVRETVEREFMEDRRKRQLAEIYARLLEKYTVVVERSESSKRVLAAGEGGR